MNGAKIVLVLLGLVLASTNSYCQHNFDTISICHNKKSQLRKIVIGEYDINIRNGELHSFSFHVDAVKYDFEK